MLSFIEALLLCLAALEPLGLLVRADQPVNCLRKQIHDQVWNFHVSQDTETVNLFESKELCGHQQPNRVQIVEKGHHFKFAKDDVWQVEIKEDYTAVANFCKNGDTKACDG